MEHLRFLSDVNITMRLGTACLSSFVPMSEEKMTLYSIAGNHEIHYILHMAIDQLSAERCCHHNVSEAMVWKTSLCDTNSVQYCDT